MGHEHDWRLQPNKDRYQCQGCEARFTREAYAALGYVSGSSSVFDLLVSETVTALHERSSERRFAEAMRGPDEE